MSEPPDSVPPRRAAAQEFGIATASEQEESLHMHVSPAASAARALWIATAGLAVMVGSASYAFGGNISVDPRGLDRVNSPLLFGTDFVAVTVVVALGTAAAAGAPRPQRATGSLGSAVGQFSVALMLILGTAIGSLLNSIWTFGPDYRCVYPSCWPANAQSLVGSLPGLVTAVAVLVAALLVGRLGWTVRAIFPACTWLLSVVALRLIWEPLLLPVFTGPPLQR